MKSINRTKRNTNIIMSVLFVSAIAIATLKAQAQEEHRQPPQMSDAEKAAFDECKSSVFGDTEMPRPQRGAKPTDAQKALMDKFQECMSAKGYSRPQHHHPQDDNSSSSSSSSSSESTSAVSQ